MDIGFLFAIVVLIFSAVVHELSHGLSAYYLGDPTAKLAGRLTLNPLKHLEWLGSLFVPTISYLSFGFLFGWAKPVPYNPYNLRGGRLAEAFVAFAGALSNMVIAIIFGLLIRFSGVLGIDPSLIQPFSLIVLINLVLAIFNLVPIPPLDGSKVLFNILPFKFDYIRIALERYSIFILIFFVFFLWKLVYPVIDFFFSFITGYNFFG